MEEEERETASMSKRARLDFVPTLFYTLYSFALHLQIEKMDTICIAGISYRDKPNDRSKLYI